MLDTAIAFPQGAQLERGNQASGERQAETGSVGPLSFHYEMASQEPQPQEHFHP